MEMDEKKSRKGIGGRPATGRKYPHKVTAYLSDEAMAWLDKWAEKHRWDRAQALREAVESVREKAL
jgi:hypothetical protein